MDELRKKRYRDKINYVINSLNVLLVEPKNELEKRGIFYSLQTSIESVIDLIAMSVKDLGIPVQDDENNISEIINKRKLNEKLGNDLKKANGMRNIIVHRYNGIDEEIILDSVEIVKDLLIKWLDIIEEMLKDIDKD